jgi:hypothetical protein
LSHALGRPYPAGVKVREPVARPLDVVAAELLLSASQAFLVGVLVYLAMGVWQDQGVAFGPVGVVVAGLGIAVGVGWLYWLLGGVGWPLAAANVPTAMFLGFALILSWQGDDLFRVEGVPLVLSLAASIYGIACGAFLDSPRRLRWDQRARPRPGTIVPRVSPTTRRAVAQVPRSLPRRPTTTLQEAIVLLPPVGAPDGAGARPGAGLGAEAGLSGSHSDPDGLSWSEVGAAAPTALDEPGAADVAATVGASEAAAPGSPAKTGEGTSSGTPSARTASTGDTGVPAMPTDRLAQAARAASTAGASTSATSPTSRVTEPGGIELPTSVEPKAQRSPWAWAAPPEWARDEDDEPPRGRSSSRH